MFKGYKLSLDLPDISNWNISNDNLYPLNILLMLVKLIIFHFEISGKGKDDL